MHGDERIPVRFQIRVQHLEGHVRVALARLFGEQVPRPPQVESIGSPIQWAALNSVVPGGMRVDFSYGR